MSDRKITPKSICIDCDGTLMFHEYPYLGAEAPHAIRVVKRLKLAGHTLILQTMRHGDLLQDAVKWCESKGIVFDYVNMNPMYETGSRKVYAHAYIDDHNIGIPMIRRPFDRKPVVDWDELERILEKNGYL
jgi:hypothetical protein